MTPLRDSQGVIRHSSGSLAACGAAIVLVAMIFGFIVPALAFVSDEMRTTFDAQWPRLALWIVQVSPWGSIALTVAVIVLLVAKERFMHSRAALLTNVAAVVGVAILGGLVCLLLLVPVVQLVQAIQ